MPLIDNPTDFSQCDQWEDFSRCPFYDRVPVVGYASRGSSGLVAIAGIGFQPSLIQLIANDTHNNQFTFSHGYDDGTTAFCHYQSGGTSIQALETVYSIYVYRSGGQYIYANIDSLDADGFTLLFNQGGTGACDFSWMCFH